MPPTLPPTPILVRWSWIALGAAGASAIAGAVFGAFSRETWQRDRAVDVDGRSAHLLTRAEAQKANGQAVAANVLFGAAAALGAGGTAALVLLPDGGPSFAIEASF